MTENEAIEIIKKDACNNRYDHKLCNDGCMYGDTKCAFSMAIRALEEVQQYRQICTPDVLEFATKLANIAKNCGTIGKVIDECVEYEKIGTVEEFRAAMEKQTVIEPEKVNIPCTSWTKAHMRYRCSCGRFLTSYDNYCNKCGQKLKWGDGK